MIAKRVGYGAVLIALIAGLFWLEHAWLPPRSGLAVAIATGALALVGAIEFNRLALRLNCRPFARLAVLSALALYGWVIYSIAAPPHTAQVAPLLWWVLTIGALFSAAALANRPPERAGDVAMTLLGLVVIPVALAQLIVLQQRFGLAVLALTLATLKFNDIAAYFTGAALGRHKPFKHLSPNKSVEGFAAGWIVSAALGLAYGLVAAPRVHAGEGDLLAAVPLAGWAVFGLLVGIAGQLGDLFESALKRQAGAKDSGDLVPSFGGVLDMIDSPLLGGPAALAILGIFTAIF